MAMTGTRLRRFGLIAVVVALLAGGFAVLMAWTPVSSIPRSEDTPARADADDPELVALGAEVYAAHCASCHGADLEGQPDWRQRRDDGRLPAPPHDETGHTWHHPDRELFEITKYGIEPFAPEGYESDMPAFEDVLSDREIWAVLAYIKSQWPESERETQARIDRRAREADDG